MKKARNTCAMTTTGAYNSPSESTGLKQKDVKAVVDGFMGLAAVELKKNGSFKIAGMLNLKLKTKPKK